MTKRNPLMVVALTFFSFTLYAYWWLYATTDELRDETGRDDLQPLMDVILAALTFGLWGFWATYRNSRIVHEEMLARGEKHSDRSIGVAVFGAMTLLTGWAWLVSMALAQEDYNRLAETEFDYFAEAEPVRARVELERDETPTAQPVEAPSRWQSAPRAPVFQSDAPMPVVY